MPENGASRWRFGDGSVVKREGLRVSPSNSYSSIYAVVKRIPLGRVATYGQIASLAGLAGHARQVGYALNALPDDCIIPWHRVINAKGRISQRSDPTQNGLQRVLLEAEGVVFDSRDTVSLKKHQWRPRS